jgi:hypothetical protein
VASIPSHLPLLEMNTMFLELRHGTFCVMREQCTCVRRQALGDRAEFAGSILFFATPLFCSAARGVADGGENAPVVFFFSLASVCATMANFL